jgi:predicted phosphodiesterase
MKVLLLHLSDIHIRTVDDIVFTRISKIVDAVKNLDSDVRAVVTVLSGDITDSGSEDQFLLAMNFVSELKTGLHQHLSDKTTVSFVAVPGNHDCDFSEASDAREVLLEAVRKTPERLSDTSFADICLAPQRRYFEFISAVDMLKQVPSGSRDRRLYVEYRLEQEGAIVTFFCCNTAALSQLHEQPGSLVFPYEIIPKIKETADVSVGVLHHPFNWFKPDSMHKFRDRLESVTDFIITGHEHTLDKRRGGGQGNTNTYLEGGVLQTAGDPAQSGFYAVLIDTTAKKQRIIEFAWKETCYVPLNCEDPQQYHLWEDFAQNRFRLSQTFQLQPDFINYLDDPELTLTHQARGQLRLSDIYVFPDLKRVNLTGERTTKIVRGESVPEFITQNPCLFIIGDDVSGKTALAKRLFHHLRGIGDVPVLIDASRVPLSLNNTQEEIEACFLKSYQPSALEKYRQLDRAKRVLIIDNYHRLKLSPRGKVDLIYKLRQHSFRLVVLAHDLELTVQDLSEAGDIVTGELPFVYYAILPFSLLRRNRLVEKWLLLSSNASHDTTQFVRNLERLTRTIDTIVGKNYVPAYPAYVLAILQATEAGTEIDLHASTHGYLYELFIKAAIAKRTSALVFNVLCAYLSHLAYWMFSQQQKHITIAQLQALHEALHEKYEVLPDFQRQTGQLLEMQLIAQHNDLITFRHPYIHYYFLALYFRDHISDQKIAGDIRVLTSQLYKVESANTLLFLAHLSKDQIILDSLLASAESQYSGCDEAKLEEDVAFLNQLSGTVSKLKIPERPLVETRQENLESQDVARAEESEFEIQQQAVIENENSILGRLNAALKTIQILGQFLKNFPANLDRPQKNRIIAACSKLGRQALGDVLGMVKRNESELLEEMLFLISRRRPGIEPEKLRNRAASAVVALCEIASTGMIHRLSYAIGSNELSTTYDRIFPLHDETIMRLLYVSLQLEHYDHFPEGLIDQEIIRLNRSPFAFRILCCLVIRHLAIFPADFRLKQRLAKLLDLDYQKVSISRDELKLLKSAR